MHQASVGFHCPECTKQGAQKIVRPQQLFNQRPVATLTLMALNVLVYVAGIGPGGSTRDSFVYDGGLIARGFDPIRLQLVGMAEGEWYRLITSGFLHANLIHIGFNMFVLYRLGQLLEPALGRVRFVVLYFVAMMGGALGVMVLDPDALTVGASGAVFGLMGGAVAVFRSRGINIMQTGLGATIMLNLVFTFAIPGISIGGHVGGLIVGFLAGWILTDIGPRYLKDPSVIMGAVAALGVVAAGASIILAGAA